MTGIPVFSANFTNQTNPVKPNYHISIKKTQAILKCFIDLKNSVWFTLASEDKTMVWHLELFSAWLPVKVFKTLNGRQSYILSKFPLWTAYTEIFGYTERIRRTLVDVRCIRIKNLRIQKSPDTCGRGLSVATRDCEFFPVLYFFMFLRCVKLV